MSISFNCACGKSVRAPDGSEGKRAKCPACGRIIVVPAPQPAPAASDDGSYDFRDPVPSPRPPAVRPPPELEAPVVQRRVADPVAVPMASIRPAMALPSLSKRSLRSWTYLLLLLGLIPLLISTFHTDPDFQTKLEQTVQDHPESAERIKALVEQQGDDVDPEEVLRQFPDDRLDGAMLARDSHVHWLIALGGGACFFAFLLGAFPRASRYTKGLLFAGIFTSTAGVLLLLFFQFIAFNMPWFAPRSVIGLVLLVIKLIGASYALAEGDHGFLVSFFGFTFGVGLCEEITKSIPMLFRIRSSGEEASWNSMLLWGLASGIGFGIAEGIMYSGHYYNGIEGAEMYVVRFVSCVVLHAMWAGAVGVTLYRRQGWLHDSSNNWDYFFKLVLIVMVPMVLHGLYDTLLKQELDAVALIVALVSFGWLAFQIERQWRSERIIGVTE